MGLSINNRNGRRFLQPFFVTFSKDLAVRWLDCKLLSLWQLICKALSLPIISDLLGKPLHHLCHSPPWEALAEVVPLYQAEEQILVAAPFFWNATGMAVGQRTGGKKVEMQVAVAFAAEEIFLSQAVSRQQPVNLSYSSCLTCWVYKSIWGGFKELFFSSLCNLLISVHELFYSAMQGRLGGLSLGYVPSSYLDCAWEITGV